MAGTITLEEMLGKGMTTVSMKSGLDGRNNAAVEDVGAHGGLRLNEVRPRWPEQLAGADRICAQEARVSMKSGLDGRNNDDCLASIVCSLKCVSMKSGLDGRNNADIRYLPFATGKESQ